MFMFDKKSRYAGLETYSVEDKRGRTVQVVTVPDAPKQDIMGYHLLKQGQRLDHFAGKYLKDPAGFWRICEANDVMQAESLSEEPEIAIPGRSK
jgi:hypothetical protein